MNWFLLTHNLEYSYFYILDMKKLGVLLSLCLGVCSAQNMPVFSPALDLPVLGMSIGIGLYGSHELRQVDAPHSVKGKSSLLPWDRPFAGTYSSKADFASDVTCVSVALPLAVGGLAFYEGSASGQETLGLFAMYLEAMSLQSGVNLLVRSRRWWPRPYVYASGHESEKEKGEAYASFYSGHASATFSAAVFSTYAFKKLYPDSKYFWPVAVGSFSLASATGVLRVAAGKHYPTDVVVGALAGSGISLAVIGVHEWWNRRIQVVALPGYAGVAVNF